MEWRGKRGQGPAAGRLKLAMRGGVALWVLACALGLTATTPLSAQTPATATSGTVQFAIAPQSLDSALTSFGAASGVQVLYNSTITQGRQSPGVSGNMTPRQALSRLLGGTGLTPRFTGPRSATVIDVSAQASPADAGAVQLDTVNVQGQGETARGPVAGYVATRSATGTKTDTPILETPQSISVVTRDQMDARAARTVVESLQYVPGVYTHTGGKDPRYDGFSIRGFAIQGYGNYRDGLRELGSADNFAHFRNETYGLERIDVVRGPNSVLYGQVSPGGLVDLISKRPTRDTIAEVVGQVSTADQFQGSFDFGGAADKEGKYQFRLSGVARDGNAQVAHFSDLMPDSRMFIAPSFTWQPTADTKLTILTDWQHDRTNAAFTVPIFKPGLTDVRALPLYLGDPNWNSFDQQQFRLGYQFEHRFNDMFTVRQNLRYGEVDLDYRYLTVAAAVTEGATSQPRVSRQIYENTSSFTVDNQLQANIATGWFQHTMLFGVDHQRFTMDSRTIGANAGVPALNLVNPAYYVAFPNPTLNLASTDQQAQQVGFYAQDQIKFANWILTLGGRYDKAELESLNRLTSVNTETDDSKFTKRVGLTYLFDMGLAPYVSYSESFFPTTGVDRLGAAFKPTTGQQYEAGVKYEIPGTKTLLTMAVFDLTQQNVLTPDPVNTNFRVQTGEIRSRGFEAQAVATLTQGLDLILSYTKLDLEVTESKTASEVGKTPVLTPTQMASAWADYTIQTGMFANLGFAAGVRYIGETFKDAANVAPTNNAYTLFDAAVHYKYRNWNWALNVNNLFDKEETACTLAGGCQYISPRIVTATIKYKW